MGLARNSVGLCIHPQLSNTGEKIAIATKTVVITKPIVIIQLETLREPVRVQNRANRDLVEVIF
ncbi:hypothetical protein NIES39_L06090 [Arthrospira platensis NIES-39]|nr:hypothetical protein NIES39_L06090 [Arthrospira platensis NIES-39]